MSSKLLDDICWTIFIHVAYSAICWLYVNWYSLNIDVNLSEFAKKKHGRFLWHLQVEWMPFSLCRSWAGDHPVHNAPKWLREPMPPPGGTSPKRSWRGRCARRRRPRWKPVQDPGEVLSGPFGSSMKLRFLPTSTHKSFWSVHGRYWRCCNCGAVLGLAAAMFRPAVPEGEEIELQGRPLRELQSCPKFDLLQRKSISEYTTPCPNWAQRVQWMLKTKYFYKIVNPRWLKNWRLRQNASWVLWATTTRFAEVVHLSESVWANCSKQ